MTMTIILLIVGIIAGWLLLRPMGSLVRPLKKGDRLTNKKGKQYVVNHRGGLSPLVEDFFSHPNVQQQVKGLNRIFKQETIMALVSGTQPPHMVGRGTYTKKSLLRDWDDEWQAELEVMNEHIDITYNSFFDIPEEHPPVGIILTAEEILAEYGSEEES